MKKPDSQPWTDPRARHAESLIRRE